MHHLFKHYTHQKRLLVLGFGREGKSTCRYILRHFPHLEFAVADKNPRALEAFDFEKATPQFFSGEYYLEALPEFDVIIKSPGIHTEPGIALAQNTMVLSQASLFLECYQKQIIGITGTKGKSTTSSLIHHTLTKSGKKSLLVGNIGVPPFDVIDAVDAETVLVYELSAHQLQGVHHSPHIAILLNLFDEHLDFFGTRSHYFQAKWNITAHQSNEDFFICDSTNEHIAQYLHSRGTSAQLIEINPSDLFGDVWLNRPEEKPHQQCNSWNSRLRGNHNEKNSAAAMLACRLAGLDKTAITEGIKTFEPLEHRLEYVGRYCSIDFYNDSISTIPQSTIEAVKTIDGVHTLILGGFDRGLDYSRLLAFLSTSQVEHLVFTGPAGKRMMDEFAALKRAEQILVWVDDFKELLSCFRHVKRGSACLLSPAASSYNAFSDFAERGRAFKKIAETFGGFCH